MEAKRKVAICIGVGQAGRPKRLPYLGAAVNGARAFHDWATALGYESKLVIDDPEPVTVARLADEIERSLKASTDRIHRFILYFAGHGLVRELEEGLWLLSDWDDKLRAVAVEGLRRRLYMYGIEQIAIFADACRKLPEDVQASDLTLDKVLGQGPVKSPTIPAIDRFIAAQDGSESYAVPGKDPNDDRCIFSGVLLEGLWGTKQTAFSQLLEFKNKITSDSLAKYLRSEVPKVAARYRYTLDPMAIPTFPQGDDIYLGDGTLPMPPTFAPWPDPKTLLQARIDAKTAVVRTSRPDIAFDGNLESFELSKSFPSDSKLDKKPPSHIERNEPSPQRKRSASSILKRLRDQPRPQSFETGSGFANQGIDVRRLWVGSSNSTGSSSQVPNWWHVGDLKVSPLTNPSPALIEFANGLFAAVTALPRFIATTTCDESGMSALIYRPIRSITDVAAPAEEALTALENGGLRVDATTDFAVQLRKFKHVDPVLGVISAYLYESIGDIESIRRMAYYYIRHRQPIPYDIALLAQLEARQIDGLLWAQVPSVPKRMPRTEAERACSWTYRAMPKSEGVIAGFWPWMRQGWIFLDDLTGKQTIVDRRLIRLLPHLQPARFATFDSDGGKKLARTFKLRTEKRNRKGSA